MKVFIDKISGIWLEDIHVLRVAKLPLPDDSWYAPTGLLVRSDYGSVPSTDFALVDDGNGLRWLPVRVISSSESVSEDLSKHPEYDDAMSHLGEVQ